MKVILKEFKDFALKGNAIDLAVGVIIGGAFGKIVTSIVNDLLMPLLSLLTGGINFADLKYVISPAKGDLAEVAFAYGSFIQSVIDFVIIALSIFLFVKLISLKRKKARNTSRACPSGQRRGLAYRNQRSFKKQITLTAYQKLPMI